MAKHLINHNLLTIFATQIRRIANTTQNYNIAEMGELLSKINGSITERENSYDIETNSEEYFVDNDIIEAMAAQIRRIADSTQLYTGAEIGEILSKIEGTISEPGGQYKIEARNYDGTIIKTSWLDTNMVFALPTNITLPDGYVLEGWVTEDEIPIDNNYFIVKNKNVTLYPIINTISGATEFITVSTSQVSLPGMQGFDNIRIDWGDGTIQGYPWAIHSASHTYSSAGIYTIKIYNVYSIESEYDFTNGGYYIYNYFTDVKLSNDIITLGPGAFYGQTNLTNIIIPHGVKTIASEAFYYCSNLTSINLPDSLTHINGSFNYSGIYNGTENWEGETPLYLNNHFIEMKNTFSGSYSILEGTITIGGSAFNNCESLTSVNIPNSVKVIGDKAFYWCKELTNVNIPSGVTTIGFQAFSNCSKITTMTIPDTVTFLDGSAFTDCTALKSIILSKNITSIESNMFWRCGALTNITIPEGVAIIKDDVFEKCSKLSSITLPTTLTTISSDAFVDCTALKDVYISDIAAWCKIKFSNANSHPFGSSEVLFETRKLYLNEQPLENLIISNSINEINDYTFYCCNGIVSITLPDTITKIGIASFQGCWSLTSITIPNKVTSIGLNAFRNCSALTSINIPKSVTNIGANAFRNCSGLTSAVYEGTAEEWANVTVESGNENLTSIITFTE